MTAAKFKCSLVYSFSWVERKTASGIFQNVFLSPLKKHPKACEFEVTDIKAARKKNRKTRSHAPNSQVDPFCCKDFISSKLRQLTFNAAVMVEAACRPLLKLCLATVGSYLGKLKSNLILQCRTHFENILLTIENSILLEFFNNLFRYIIYNNCKLFKLIQNRCCFLMFRQIK